MADFHRKSFFGVDTGIIVESPARLVPYIFIRCIRRKDDGTWEKYSKGEGKIVKISIEEIICILEVLRRNSANWRGYHVFKDYQTEIYVGWEDEGREVLLVKIGDYTKKLRFPNTNFLTLLLEHILDEKIEFATSGTFELKQKQQTIDEGDYRIFSERITSRDGLPVVETTEYDVLIDTIKIEATIKVESPKALLISLNSGKEFWIPKNTVHNQIDIKNKTTPQTIAVDKWIIEKNKVF